MCVSYLWWALCLSSWNSSCHNPFQTSERSQYVTGGCTVVGYSTRHWLHFQTQRQKTVISSRSSWHECRKRKYSTSQWQGDMNDHLHPPCWYQGRYRQRQRLVFYLSRARICYNRSVHESWLHMICAYCMRYCRRASHTACQKHWSPFRLAEQILSTNLNWQPCYTHLNSHHLIPTLCSRWFLLCGPVMSELLSGIASS